MDLGQPLSHARRDAKGRVGHCERSEYMFGEINIRLLADPIDIDAVLPAITRIEEKR